VLPAISKSLAAEVAQFGIRVLFAVPGGFRPSQLDRHYTMYHHVSNYDGYREEILGGMQLRWKQAQDDSAQTMEVFVDAIKGERKVEGWRCRRGSPWGSRRSRKRRC